MLAPTRRLPLLLLLAIALSVHAFGQPYKYFRLGHAQDSHTTPVPGYALMGGG
jgi:hypothetical protein